MFTFPLVVGDFIVVVFCCFDAKGRWSEVVGGARRAGEAAAPLLVPNCLVGEDGGVPMMVPWELGMVSRWDTHGWTAATPQVSMREWTAWMVLWL